MEVYTLTISFPYADEDEPWSKTFEAKEDFTLIKLHYYIQQIIEFDNDHLHEFKISKTPGSQGIPLPDNKRLNEIYPITGYKLYYLFDFGDSWLFQIKKERIKKFETEGTLYPILIKSSGVNPKQYPDYDEDE